MEDIPEPSSNDWYSINAWRKKIRPVCIRRRLGIGKEKKENI